MHKKAYGFTIVELLIVIVVIGILAAITIVAYNGMQQRAEVAAAKVDLRNIATRMELHRTHYGKYPITATGNPGGYPEVAEVLREAGLYESTRNKPDNTQDKAFLFCGYATTDTYTVVAVRPVLSPVSGSSAAGQILYYVTPQGMKEATYTWDDAIGGSNPTGVNLCHSVDPAYQTVYGNVWSHNAPTPLAP